jgi:hypothetical protein
MNGGAGENKQCATVGPRRERLRCIIASAGRLEFAWHVHSCNATSDVYVTPGNKATWIVIATCFLVGLLHCTRRDDGRALDAGGLRSDLRDAEGAAQASAMSGHVWFEVAGSG